MLHRHKSTHPIEINKSFSLCLLVSPSKESDLQNIYSEIFLLFHLSPGYPNLTVYFKSKLGEFTKLKAIRKLWKHIKETETTQRLDRHDITYRVVVSTLRMENRHKQSLIPECGTITLRELAPNSW